MNETGIAAIPAIFLNLRLRCAQPVGYNRLIDAEGRLLLVR